MNAQTLDTAATESLLAFWRDAGVDACFEDAPVDRTVFIAPPAAQAVQKATASVTILKSGDVVADARRLAAGADSLEALAEAVAAFEGCPLRSMGARRPVFSRGNPSGGLMVIGEAPGEAEDASGQPFVGKPGQLLDRILTAGGLLDEAFIVNTVFWRPPGDRPPTAQEQAACAPFVERAFALLKPRAVLTVGAAAAKSVLKTDEGLMKIRGEWREWRLPEGDVSAPVMATLHPAFLLRQPQAKRAVWADILNLSARLMREKVEADA